VNWQKAKVTFIAAKVQLFFEIIILEVTNFTGSLLPKAKSERCANLLIPKFANFQIS